MYFNWKESYFWVRGIREKVELSQFLAYLNKIEMSSLLLQKIVQTQNVEDLGLMRAISGSVELIKK